MAISSEIKYDFDQIKTGLLAFVGDLEAKLQKILPDLPVFVLQTGDASYYLNSKFVETDNKEVYQKTPRFVIGFEDIQPQTEQNTNKYNKVIFKKDDIEYVTKCKRFPVILTVTTDFISSNFLKGLENYEILSTITSRQNAFTYEFMGNTFEGAYALSSTTLEKPGMDVSAATRNFVVKTPLEIQLHLLMPRIESIQKLTDAQFDTTEFDLISHGEIDATYKLNFDKTE